MHRNFCIVGYRGYQKSIVTSVNIVTTLATVLTLLTNVVIDLRYCRYKMSDNNLIK